MRDLPPLLLTCYESASETRVPWWRQTLRSGGNARLERERNPVRIERVAEPVEAARTHPERTQTSAGGATHCGFRFPRLASERVSDTA